MVMKLVLRDRYSSENNHIYNYDLYDNDIIAYGVLSLIRSSSKISIFIYRGEHKMFITKALKTLRGNVVKLSCFNRIELKHVRISNVIRKIEEAVI